MSLPYKKCPKCGATFSKRQFMGIKGRFADLGKRLQYRQTCPECHGESYHYNKHGNTDSESWISLEETFIAHSFDPRTLIECDNTGCYECAFSTPEHGYKDGDSRLTCPQRKRLSGQGYQADLTAWGITE